MIYNLDLTVSGFFLHECDGFTLGSATALYLSGPLSFSGHDFPRIELPPVLCYVAGVSVSKQECLCCDWASVSFTTLSHLHCEIITINLTTRLPFECNTITIHDFFLFNTPLACLMQNFPGTSSTPRI